MTKEQAKHIVDVAFDVPLAVRRIGEDRTYQEDEIREAKNMAIKALEQEPKIGHWEYVQYDYNPKLGNWHCSECRCIAVECVNKEKENSNPLYKFCPNCGAKMESEVRNNG